MAVPSVDTGFFLRSNRAAPTGGLQDPKVMPSTRSVLRFFSVSLIPALHREKHVSTLSPR